MKILDSNEFLLGTIYGLILGILIGAGIVVYLIEI
jgi:hypothetical protein